MRPSPYLLCLRRLRFAAAVAFAAFLAAAPLAAAPPPETRIAITLPAGWPGDASGRLLVFARPAKADDKPADRDEVDSAEFGAADAVSVAARDVAGFGVDRRAVIDTQDTAFPAGFAALPPGDYRVQAVLDRDGDYNYGGRGPGDLVSKVVTIHWPEAAPAAIALDHEVPAVGAWDFPGARPASLARIAAVKPHLQEILFHSPALTAFSGRDTVIKAWVLPPPGYDPKARETWPTVYEDDGFGSTHKTNIAAAGRIWALEASGAIPPMIWVFLDHGGPTGTTEFADSVNNGPRGQALTAELIPALETRWRMDAKPSGRFLTGHSSGGWSALWLQVRYPKTFGGSWPTSPDPSDFHDFTGVDLYAPGANAYQDAAGKPRPLVRDHAKVLATLSDFARLEAVLGHDGGQFRSFDWVFSPRAADGTPMYLFDRRTGAVDPAVVAYWRDHYDIAHLIETHATALRRDLDGKIHLTVGTADTFYLDGSAHLLDAAMKRAGIGARFTYVPDRTHFDLYRRGDDEFALTKDIARAMYAVARPGAAWTPAPEPSPQPKS